jgi:hypothetical protein
MVPALNMGLTATGHRPKIDHSYNLGVVLARNSVFCAIFSTHKPVSRKKLQWVAVNGGRSSGIEGPQFAFSDPRNGSC